MMTIPKVRISLVDSSLVANNPVVSNLVVSSLEVSNLEANNPVVSSLEANNLVANNLVANNLVKLMRLFVIDFQTLKKHGLMHLVGIRHTIIAMSLQRLVSKSVLTMPLAKMA